MGNRLAVSTLHQRLSRTAKQWVLCGKSGSFALQDNRFRNGEAKPSLFNGIIFTKSVQTQQSLTKATKVS
ncbi:hypothetical protein [Prevotella nigrescens]|uniref:hypothetical protein n=1 Tax=Prevotella nigrescens TaxID=28133 RepID=UPI00241F216D|nr:hypothetical protein [Prevotella nigrescens]